MFIVANAKVSKVEKYFIVVLVDSHFMNRILCEKRVSEWVLGESCLAAAAADVD